MKKNKRKKSLFREKILNNRFVIQTIILLIMSITILSLSKIGFILKPIAIIIGSIALPVLLSGIGFYLLNPVVDFLERRNVKRPLSIIILYVIITGIITGISFAIIPPLKSQIQDFAQSTPKLVNDIKEMIDRIIQTNIFTKTSSSLQLNTDQIIERIVNSAGKYGSNVLGGIFSAVGTITEVILAIAMLPILLYYMLKEGKNFPHHIVKLLPDVTRRDAKIILSDMSRGLSLYIRGQIIVSICVGMLLFIGYLIIGLEYPLLLATIATLTNIVPYLGPIIAVLPAAIVAIAYSPAMLVKLAIVWGIAQFLESKGISPQVMGKSLQIHPITVIFVIIIAGNFFGIIGIILAVPGYTILKVITTHIYRYFRLYSSMYSDTKIEKHDL